MTKLFTSNLAKSAGKVDEKTLKELRAAYRAPAWVRYILRPLFMATLVLAIMVGLLVIIRAVTLDERWSMLTVLFFFIILEAIYTTNWIKHPDRLRLDRSSYRGAELLLILIIVRLATWYIFEGVLPDAAQLTLYLVNPLALFLNGQFLVTLLLALIAWRLANMLGDIFMELEVSEFELQYYSLPPAQRKARSDDKPIMASRRQMVLRFIQYWLWGGILLAFTIGLSTLEISSLNTLKNPLAIGRLGLRPELLIVLLLYFGIGFYLLSQAKLMEMNARWLLNDITKDDQMQRTWQRSSLIILLLIGLIAAFLPIGPNLAIGWIIAAVMYVLFLIANLLIFLLSLPLLLLYALFSGRPVEEVPPQPPLSLEALEEAMPPEVSSLSETVAMVLSSAFWTVIIIGVVLALLFFLRERKGILKDASADQILHKFWEWVKNLWWSLGRRIVSIQWQLPRLFAAKEVEPQSEDGQGRRLRFFRLGALTPREQIRYFYLSTVRRAGEKGVKREAAETPLEFVEDLKDGWPTVEEEVEDLTGAFLKARYSDEPITAEDIPDIKESWKDVRKQLKQRSQPDEDGAQD